MVILREIHFGNAAKLLPQICTPYTWFSILHFFIYSDSFTVNELLYLLWFLRVAYRDHSSATFDFCHIGLKRRTLCFCLKNIMSSSCTTATGFTNKFLRRWSCADWCHQLQKYVICIKESVENSPQTTQMEFYMDTVCVTASNVNLIMCKIILDDVN